MTVYYLDHESGNDANAGTSFVNRKKTMASLPALVAADEVRVIASPDATTLGNGTWTDGTNVIALATPLPVKVLEEGSDVWMPSTNVTIARNNTYAMDGVSSVVMSILGAFTTGKAGYRPVGDIAAGAVSAARSPNLLGAAALTLLVSATADTAIQTITLPFDILFQGQFYNQVTVGSNSWLVFGPTATASNTTNVNGAALQVGAADNSWQRLYAGAENSGDTYRIRFEGTNATSGTVGSPNIVWEATFHKNAPGQIEVDIGANTYKTPSVTGGTLAVGSIPYPMATTASAGYDITQAITAWDLSAYDTISVPYAGSIPMNSGYFALCSDVKGDTVVHTIPFVGDYGVSAGTATPNTMTLCLKRFGTALSNSIKSIAVYFSTDPGSGSTSLGFDNMIATTTASGVDHSMVIGKKTTDEPWFYNVKSITPSAVIIGHAIATGTDLNGGVAATSRPYAGNTETVPTYLQRTMFAPYLSTERTPPGSVTWAAFTGGWNRADMSTRTGKSYVRLWGSTTPYMVTGSRNIQYSAGFCVIANGGPFVTTSITNGEDLDFISQSGANIWNAGVSFTVACAYKIGYINQSTQINLYNNTNGAAADFDIGAIVNSYSTTGGVIFSSTGRWNVGRPARPIRIGRCHNGGGYGVSASTERKWKGITFTNNRLGEVYAATDNTAEFLECVGLNTVMVTGATSVGMVNTKDTFWQYGATAKLQGTVVHASATALQIAPTLATVTQLRPAYFSVGQIAVAAGVPITIKAWGRKDNVGLTCGIMIAGGFISGIETDQIANVSAANTWEELSLTVTPTVDGIIEVLAQAYGGTTFNGYITELSWST